MKGRVVPGLFHVCCKPASAPRAGQRDSVARGRSARAVASKPTSVTVIEGGGGIEGEKWRFLLPGTSEPRLEVRTTRA
ncbi:hypothetical protein MES5069_70193 [Mesorhizobium escarrei]|uniref:Uncharacterized protein n=1 Tax=Mesorhizobium escarrei TaxID=666018 RepID=A0ABM9EGV4_9HYPH|nr:hypothetical protein MES5069_70193 [Mesorhizobium escarrei]